MDNYFMHKMFTKEQSDNIVKMVENGISYKYIEETYHFQGLSNRIYLWNRKYPDKKIIPNKVGLKDGKNRPQEYFLSNFVSKEDSDKIIQLLKEGHNSQVIGKMYGITGLNSKVSKWNKDHAERTGIYIECNYREKLFNDTYGGRTKDEILQLIDNDTFVSTKDYARFLGCSISTFSEFMKRNRLEKYKSMVNKI